MQLARHAGRSGSRAAATVMALALLFLVHRMIWLEGLHHPLWQALALAAGFLLLGGAITGGWRTGAAIGGLLYFAVRGLSEAKRSVLQQPLTAADVRDLNASELLELATAYPRFTLAGAALLGVVAVCWWWMRTRPQRVGPGLRLAVLAGALALGWVAADHTAGMTLGDASPESTSVLNLMSTFYNDPPSLPAAGPAVPHAPAVTCPAHPVNVMLVMEESTYRPLDAESAGVPTPFYQGTLFGGPLHSHTIGGKTHVSEFAVLLGLPHTALAGENTYPQVPLLGRVHRSLAFWLKGCGYETTVVYPTRRHFRNSARWYPSIGFDHVFSGEDVGIAGWHDPDRSIFAKALAQLAARGPGRPQLLYVLTISQHGPYAKGRERGDYLERLRRSGSDLLALRHTLEAAPGGRAGWILAWYGDHRPGGIDTGGDDRWTTWGAIDRIGTPPAPPVTSAAAHPGVDPTLDLAFFGDRVLAELGLHVEPLDTLRDRMRTRCAADYMACPQALRYAVQREFIDIGGLVSGPAPLADAAGAP